MTRALLTLLLTLATLGGCVTPPPAKPPTTEPPPAPSPYANPDWDNPPP